MSDPLARSTRYQVVRRLAAGGMGEVLLARFLGDEHVTPGLVVLKRTLPNSPQKSHQDDMLREEGRIAMRLLHDNLVETFFIDEVEGEPLLAMEYLPGRSMAQALGAARKNKQLVPVDVCLAVLRAAACGLHFAHTLQDRGRPLGLVHRDVSPANVFVTFDGKVKVIDFGVAKAEDSELQTSTGILKGKIGYMSPEHALGQKLSPASDMWALGVVLWESLLADRLFLGQNPSVTLYQITTKPLDPPSKLRPDVPPGVDELCMRLLERDIGKRVQSGAELVELLDRLPEARGLHKVQLGKFLTSRFESDAAQGLREAAESARSRRRTPVPAGLVDGGSPVAEPDEDVATAVLDREALAALTRKTVEAQARAHAGDASAGSPAQDCTDEGFAVEGFDGPEAAPPGAEDGGQTAVLDVGDLRTEPGTDPRTNPRALLATEPEGDAVEPERGGGPPPRTAPSAAAHRRAPSPISVAFGTFGALALAMGAAFSLLAQKRPVDLPPPLYAYEAPAGHDVVVGSPADAPPDAAGSLRPLDPRAPLLRGPGDAAPRPVEPAALVQRLQDTGVLRRALQPKTPRARLAAGLPAAIALIGLASLAVAAPSLLLPPGRRRAALAVGLVALVLLAGELVRRRGALGWPGVAALEPEEPPRLEWR